MMRAIKSKLFFSNRFWRETNAGCEKVVRQNETKINSEQFDPLDEHVHFWNKLVPTRISRSKEKRTTDIIPKCHRATMQIPT